ncbi:MAG: 16S rRNA (guanine(966)-N(2))-methyltransferase RsmD [Opitutaceae bacterium]|nr:16S rRNA (guanine(966)-N(2))-methyltransferase RsmD [Opitutaceae bacterium]|tara:strand:- start:6278 stop:6844 length:567 start_codon:yes stop_codon:yes gene_type:complete
MRITGGQARGITLVTPKGDATRPATDGMREAVFSSLGPRVNEAHFLDLFAGSGAYGLEALSRGASSGTWVERNGRAAGCIKKNIAAVGKSLRRELIDSNVVMADALTLPWSKPMLPDLVFIDPPYDIILEVHERLFSGLAKLLAAHPDPWIVFEMPGEIELAPEGWELVKRLGKGARQPSVRFYRRAT